MEEMVKDMQNLTWDECMTVHELVKSRIVPKGDLRVKILKVYDGDTVWFGINYNGTPMRFKLRLDKIDTKEMRGEKEEHDRFLAQQAKNVVQMVCEGKCAYIRIYKLGNFKRFIGELHTPIEYWDEVSAAFEFDLEEEFNQYGQVINGVKCLDIGQWLLRNGLADLYQ